MRFNEQNMKKEMRKKKWGKREENKNKTETEAEAERNDSLVVKNVAQIIIIIFMRLSQLGCV